MSELQLLNEFRIQIVKFLDELIDQFPESCAEFVIIRIFVKDQIPLADVLGRFISEVLPFKKVIKNRDSNFFLESRVIYDAVGGSQAGADNVNQLKILWESERLDDEDRETIWKWMDLFVLLAERYFKKYGAVAGWPVNE